MREIMNLSELNGEICELTSDEIDCVSGGGAVKAAAAAGVAAAIGAGTFGGAGWMAMGVAVAWAAAPVAVVALAGLSAYAAYEFFTE